MPRRKYRAFTLIAGAAAAALVKPAGAATVGYWRFEEGVAGQAASGTGTIIDSSGNGNNGTAFNDPIYSSSVPVSVIPNTGATDTLSMDFTGNDARISVPDSSSLELTNSMTLEAYIDPKAGSEQVIFRGDDRGGLDPYSLNVVGGDLVFGITDANNDNASVQYPLPELNQWLYVAGTLNGATGVMDIYINDTLVGTTTTTIRPLGALDSADNPGVGIGNTQSGTYNEQFIGLIDEVRISNTALLPSQLLDAPGGGGVSGPPQWAVNAAGDWNNPANWTGPVPDGVGAEADFFGAITSAHTVYTDTPVTVGTIHFNNANTYVLTGASNLTLQAATGTSALVQVDQGTQEINLPTTIASNATFNVASGANLLIANPLTVNSGVSVMQSGRGSVTYQSVVTVQTGASLAFASSTIGNTLTLESQGHAAIVANSNSTVQFNTLNIGQGASLDVGNNNLVINFGSPSSDPVAAIAGYLATGYFNGSWTGAGINSSTAADTPSTQFAVGYADGNTDVGTAAAPNQILVKYTLVGDANLDGIVNFADLAAVLKNFQQADTDWAQGNFGYVPFGSLKASTTFADLADVLKNFLQVAPGAGAGETLGGTAQGLSAGVQIQSTVTALPEPTSLSLLAAGAAGLLRRRRRNCLSQHASKRR